MNKREVLRLTRKVSFDQISEAIEDNKLLCLSVKLPVGCNLSCRYCYSKIDPGDFSYDELLDVFSQAVAIGASFLSIVGEGEPLIYKDKKTGRDIYSLVKDANDLGLGVILYTNSTFIDDKVAENLYRLKVSVIAKLNSLNGTTQDFLTGTEGAFRRVKQGLECLKRAGFNSTKASRLAVHTIICKQNYDEIPTMWRQWRQTNIIPYVQILVPSSNQNDENFQQLKVSETQIKDLFYRLSQLDNNEFGFAWDPDYTYPIAGLGCSVVKTGCCVNSRGKVQMCGYLDQELGDLRKQPLSQIMATEEVKQIRRHNYSFNPCSHFYGCRALTFNITGDRFAQDPMFWEKSK